MLSLPRLIFRIKVAMPVIYLWRVLRFALPLLVASIAFGLAPQFARIII